MRTPSCASVNCEFAAGLIRPRDMPCLATRVRAANVLADVLPPDHDLVGAEALGALPDHRPQLFGARGR
jgi:hypothetical protein